MREVKADSKGRLTGAKGGESYTQHVSKDGVITYVPAIPVVYDEVRDVTQEQFRTFWGCSPAEMAANSDMTVPLREGYASESVLPNGLVLEQFVFDEAGRKIPGANNEVLKRKVLIRILK